MLVDTHTHLQMRQFDADRDQVIASAFAAGVERLIIPGIEVASSRDAVALAARFPGQLFCGVGIHPHDATTFTDAALTELAALASQPGVVAIGEIGLDYYRDFSPPEIQRAALIAQFQLARERNLPVILHIRESHSDMLAHLRAHGHGLRGVFHCFSGDQAMARDALDLGFYLSFAGPLTFPRNVELAAVAAWAPADRILVETDSPYLAPPPFRGKRNEPRHVALVAHKLAELRGTTPAAIAELTAQNAATLFHLSARASQEG